MMERVLICLHRRRMKLRMMMMMMILRLFVRSARMSLCEAFCRLRLTMLRMDFMRMLLRGRMRVWANKTLRLVGMM